ncbi:MAG TPA: hypothetical protein VL856_00150 [Acidimicrobiia bacterium]|nr:hypothetical protein [Acidimicrobiia bacterium]
MWDRPTVAEIVMRVVLLSIGAAVVGDARADEPAKTCFPECSPGYVCNPNTGSCVEACNPPCASGTRCSAARICEPIAAATAPAATVPTATAPTGTGRLCITRKFNYVGSAIQWGVAVDGDTVGTIWAGNTQCFDAAFGSHKVTLSIVGEGIDIHSTTTVSIPAEGAHIQAREKGSTIVFE